MKSLFEQLGGTYRIEGDYYVPNLTVPDESAYQIGIWGQRRLNFLKRYRPIIYGNLLTSGKLYEHLRDIDETAFERHELLTRQMAAAQGVTEKLKVENQMEWVGSMNTICACADEVIQSELIYD